MTPHTPITPTPDYRAAHLARFWRPNAALYRTGWNHHGYRETPPYLMTVYEIADRCGVSPNAIYQRIRRNSEPFPIRKHNGRYYALKADVQAYVAEMAAD